MADLEAQVEQLNQKVAELMARLNTDSSSSHRPPARTVRHLAMVRVRHDTGESATCRRQRRSIIDWITEALRAAAGLIPVPSLLKIHRDESGPLNDYPAPM